MLIKLKHWLRYIAESIEWTLWICWFSIANPMYALFIKGRKDSQISSILVLHNMRVGDTIAITPLLRFLKSKLKRSQIDIVTSPIGAAVLMNSKDVNFTYTYDIGCSLVNYFRFLKNLRNKKYQAVIDLNNRYSGWRREFMSLATSAPLRISFKRKGYRAAWPTREIEYKYIHAADIFMLPAIALGLHPEVGKGKYRLSLSEEEILWAQEKLKAIQAKLPVVLLNPTTLDINKQWEAGRFAEVADRLVKELNATIIITAAPEEKDLAEAVSKKMKTLHHSLAGSTTLRQYISMIAASQLVLTVDTAAVHAAQAFDIPVVALFNPATHPFWQPLPGSRAVALIKSDLCNKCWQLTPGRPAVWRWKCDKPNRDCMKAISTEEVFDACRLMLGDK
jgi:ADP-heptose:LPS heptosyltransferase